MALIHSLEKKLQSMETNVEGNTSQIKTNTDNIKEFAEASKKDPCYKAIINSKYKQFWNYQMK